MAAPSGTSRGAEETRPPPRQPKDDVLVPDDLLVQEREITRLLGSHHEVGQVPVA